MTRKCAVWTGSGKGSSHRGKTTATDGCRPERGLHPRGHALPPVQGGLPRTPLVPPRRLRPGRGSAPGPPPAAAPVPAPGGSLGGWRPLCPPPQLSDRGCWNPSLNKGASGDKEVYTQTQTHAHTHVHAPRSRCGRPAPPAAQVTVSQTRPALLAHGGSALSSANAPEIQPSTMQNAPVHVLKLLRNVFFPKEILRQTSVWQTEEGGPCRCRAGREVPGRPSSSVRQGARPARHPSPPGRRGHLASV